VTLLKNKLKYNNQLNKDKKINLKKILILMNLKSQHKFKHKSFKLTYRIVLKLLLKVEKLKESKVMLMQLKEWEHNEYHQKITNNR